jgi:Flp pilus assembly protein TadG
MPRRRGAATLEFAFVAPLLFLFFYAVCITGLVVSRYQQVAALARDCARWASVHGATWANKNNGGTLMTQQDVFSNVLPNRAFLLNVATLEATSTVTWDDSAQKPTTSSGAVNRVHVTINYSVSSETMPLVGTIFGNTTLQSTSERAVNY